MYCNNCHCNFVDWVKKCPNCKTSLIEDSLPKPAHKDRTIAYTKLVEVIRDHNGSVTVDLSTTDVMMQKKWTFPYFGFGYAWAKNMYGTSAEISVELTSAEIGKRRQTRFPYLGYGFAWVKSFNGIIGGNEFRLSARDVTYKKTWSFPYFGFGRAWTKNMSGECGNQIKVDLTITEHGSSRKWGNFPILFLGYGFAWEKRGLITFSINQMAFGITDLAQHDDQIKTGLPVAAVFLGDHPEYSYLEI